VERDAHEPPDSTVTVGNDDDAALVRRVDLDVIEGPGRGRRFSSTGGERLTIGSHESCDLVIDDPTVSRFHCELRVQRRVRVRDVGSRNGTFLDGVEVREAYARDGARLRLGRSVVRLDLGAPTSAPPPPGRDRFGALFERAAASNATVVLEGETGTGKTLAARSIHAESSRSGGPFVLIDCAAVPPTLLESDLFGHERGSFTGADMRRVGAFEEAAGGTLFLDEIGELPADLQPKLLGVLENRELRRIGGSEVHKVDVRVIAATNRDLREEVNAGRFRADLYYRLAVLRIVQPPLRERREDVPAIAAAMLRTSGASEQQIQHLLIPSMCEQLARAPWPGNLRELRNYLERCLVFDAPQPFETSWTLPDDAHAALPYYEAKERVVRAFERRYLVALLEAHANKVTRAAAEAGIDRTYFYRLLRRHGISP
jgi:transcriptional regulator of acetoin/glycerol metabolism